jgi:hypothetical protein
MVCTPVYRFSAPEEKYLEPATSLHPNEAKGYEIRPGIGSENEIEDPTTFPLSITEDCFDDDIGNSSKASTFDLKGLIFEPARQDLEEFMASKENLLELSAIISRNWSTTVEEDGSYIRIYPDSKTIYWCLQAFSF